MRNYTKWEYQLPTGVIIKEAVRRAFTMAESDPPGPVFMTLPREILAQTWQPEQVASFLAEQWGPMDKVHVGIPGTEQLAAHGDRRGTGKQHDRNARAKGIVHTHRRVRRAGINVHQHSLRLAGHAVVTRRHMQCSIFVRAEDDFRVLSPFRAPLRHGLDNGRMVGTHVAEQIFDTDLVHRLQPIRGGHVGRGFRPRRGDLFGTSGHGLLLKLPSIE